MTTSKQPEGHPVFITFESVGDLPILLANAFSIQASGDGSFVFTIAQAAPPIFTGNPDEQQRQLAQIKSINGRVLARLVITPAKMKELVDLLQGTLQTYEAMTKGDDDGTSGVPVTQQQPKNSKTGRSGNRPG